LQNPDLTPASFWKRSVFFGDGFKAGANAYFVKPLDHDVLLARMAFLLGEKTQKKEGGITDAETRRGTYISTDVLAQRERGAFAPLCNLKCEI
jgi:hypothetical protein